MKILINGDNMSLNGINGNSRDLSSYDRRDSQQSSGSQHDSRMRDAYNGSRDSRRGDDVRSNKRRDYYDRADESQEFKRQRMEGPVARILQRTPEQRAKTILDNIRNLDSNSLHKPLEIAEFDNDIPLLKALINSTAERKIPLYKTHFKHYLKCAIRLKRHDVFSSIMDSMESKTKDPCNCAFINNLINQCCEQKNMEAAEWFFNWMQEKGLNPNTITYNTMFKGYRETGDEGKAKKLFEEMLKTNNRPDQYTICTLINACHKHKWFVWAIELFDRWSDTVFDQKDSKGSMPILNICNSMIDMYFEQEQSDKVEPLLKKMKMKNIKFNAYTYGYIIDGLCRRNRVKEAWKYFQDMEIKPTGHIFCTLIVALLKAEQTNQAFEILEKWRENKIPFDMDDYQRLIDGCHKAHQYDCAIKLFDEMQSKGNIPSRTCDVMINIYFAIKRGDQVIPLLEKMKGNGIKPTIRTVNEILLGWCKEGNIDYANKVFTEMRIEPDTHSFNIMINAFFKDGKPNQAIALMEKMVEKKIPFDLVTFQISINACIKAQELKLAINLVDMMKAMGMEPDEEMYRDLIDACRKGEEWDLAIKFFNEMQEKGIIPSLITFNQMLDVYFKKGWDIAPLLKEMEKNVIQSNQRTFTIILKGLCEIGKINDAVKYFDQIPKNRYSYDILMDGLFKANRFDQAFALYNERVRKGIPVSHITFNILIYGCHNAGQIEKRQEYIKQARGYFEELKLNLKPNFINYATMIHVYCYAGLVDEACKIGEEMVANGITPDETIVDKINSLVDLYNLFIIEYNAVLAQRQLNVFDVLAHELEQKMRELGFDPSRVSLETTKRCLNALMNHYCLQKRFDQVHRLFVLMIDNHIKPDKETLQIFSQGYVDWLHQRENSSDNLCGQEEAFDSNKIYSGDKFGV